MAKQDVFSIYEDLKRRVLGISDATKPPEGFVMSFLPIGRPINPDDYADPWTPDLAVDTPPAGGDNAEANTATIQKITKRQRNLQNLSRLVDHKLLMDGSGRVVPNSSTISETWKGIIAGASAAPVTEINDPIIKERINKATALLMKPDPEDQESLIETNSYLRYKDCKKKYVKACQAYTAQYVASMMNPVTAQTWPILGKTYLADVESAMDDWLGLGKKEKIENAINVLASQGTDASTAMIASAKKKFDAWQVAAGMINDTVPYVELLPSNWCELDNVDDGWTQYSYNHTQSKSNSSTDTTAWEANASVNVGFWNATPKADGSDSVEESAFTSENLEIDLSYAVIDIERPWMSSVLLNIGNWFLHGYKKEVISNGKSGQERPDDNEGFWLPAVPTQLIVIKNLRIKADSISDTCKKLKSQIGINGSVGWGPFAIGGSYSHDKNSTSQSFDMDKEWLIVDGMQIIGWISQVVPASPQMDAPNALLD